MKTKSTLTLIFLFLIISFSNAQPFGHWRTGGNPLAGIDGVNGTNNFLGTNAGVNFPINIITNGTERFKIMPGGTTNTDGRIAMGNNLLAGFTPLSRLHLHQTSAVNTVRFTTDNMAGGVGFEVGYNANSNNPNTQFAEIHNYENSAIKFT